MSLQGRKSYHENRSGTAHDLSDEHAEPTRVLYRIEEALHDLGVTIAIAATPPEMDAELEEARRRALDDFKEVLERHQDVIERAHQGMSPWGEIKMVGNELQAALGVLRNLL